MLWGLLFHLMFPVLSVNPPPPPCAAQHIPSLTAAARAVHQPHTEPTQHPGAPRGRAVAVRISIQAVRSASPPVFLCAFVAAPWAHGCLWPPILLQAIGCESACAVRCAAAAVVYVSSCAAAGARLMAWLALPACQCNTAGRRCHTAGRCYRTAGRRCRAALITALLPAPADDMDYTLVHYDVEQWEVRRGPAAWHHLMPPAGDDARHSASRVQGRARAGRLFPSFNARAITRGPATAQGKAYAYGLQALRDMGVPVEGLRFDRSLVIRGLIMDTGALGTPRTACCPAAA